MLKFFPFSAKYFVAAYASSIGSGYFDSGDGVKLTNTTAAGSVAKNFF